MHALLPPESMYLYYTEVVDQLISDHHQMKIDTLNVTEDCGGGPWFVCVGACIADTCVQSSETA